MTADVELLPLPEDYDVFGANNDNVQDYARANVAHATAAKDAEIEALRAEVSGLRAARIAYANEFLPTEDGEPDTGNVHANIRALKARAERDDLQRWQDVAVQEMRGKDDRLAALANERDALREGLADVMEVAEAAIRSGDWRVWEN